MLEYLFRIYPQKSFPEGPAFEAGLRSIYGGHDLTFDYDDPLFSAADIPTDAGLDNLRNMLAHNRPALGWTVTAEKRSFGGILARNLKSVVLRGDDDATVIQQAIHLGKWVGPNVYRLDFVAGETLPLYISIGIDAKGTVPPELAEKDRVFQLPLDGTYDQAFLARIVPAMRMPVPPPFGEEETAEEKYSKWNAARIRELRQIPGYRSGQSCDETFFLRPINKTLSVDEAAANLFSALGLKNYVSFRDKREFDIAYQDENWDIWLKRASYYDHPDYMFWAQLSVRVGEMPDAAHWENEEILDKTMAIIGLPILEAGFEIVVDVQRHYYDYTSFQAREYYIETDEHGAKKLAQRDIMMVKSRKRP